MTPQLLRVRHSGFCNASSITSVRTGLKRPHSRHLSVEAAKFRRLRGLPLYCQRTTFRMFLGHSNKTVSHFRWSAITGAKTHSGIPPSFPLCFRMLNILGGLGALHAFHRIAAILTGGYRAAVTPQDIVLLNSTQSQRHCPC